ncbi:MAG: hypothetical protein EXR72_05050 [Myxococcales bacterium]|nr:hypothetical protein [Myxococcales bacterium]
MRRRLAFAAFALAACSPGTITLLDGSTADQTLGAADLPKSSPDLGGNGPTDDLATANADLTTSPDLAVAATYPQGPYGNKVGDTLPPLEWEGYVNDAADAIATTKNFGPYSMDALRKSGRPYAMLHISEFG